MLLQAISYRDIFINQNIFTRLLEYYMIGIYIAIVKSKHLMTAGRSRNLYLLILYVAFMIILARNLMSVSSGTYMNYQLYPLSQRPSSKKVRALRPAMARFSTEILSRLISPLYDRLNSRRQ